MNPIKALNRIATDVQTLTFQQALSRARELAVKLVGEGSEIRITRRIENPGHRMFLFATGPDPEEFMSVTWRSITIQ